ncbi:hypothetical protein HHK36_002012 [Tetracentron sinense]|uniref:Uncharacterized protein n=1 Tax=Tetracentron sinense TaxID=13715 RepID=A0A834ZTQ3_TETSI|nr:hypothetical protein HHK36_002012 [Tetracentron sinense]
MVKGEKNKFLLCFRPLDMDGAIKSEGTEDPVFSYIAVEKKDNYMIPAILSSLSEKENSKISPRKRNARQVFSRVLRAVMFETSLIKKVRSRKVRQDLCRSDSNLSAKSEKFSDINRRKSSEDDGRKIDSTVSSSLSSSCSSSTTSTYVMPESKNSRSLADQKESFGSNCFEQKQSKKNLQDPQRKTKGTVTRCFSSSAGLYLLLISLSIMIFWGRICAIFCTSAWLYFVYRWNSGDGPPENGNKSPEMDSREYKKKVIMEGLLERNRHRGQ